MMKKIYILGGLLFACMAIYAQEFRFFTIADRLNSMPIAGAYMVSINNKDIATFSNEEGVVKIDAEFEGELLLSHLSYGDIVIQMDVFFDRDTLFLDKAIFSLPEATIMNTTKKALLEIIKYNITNYKKHYYLDDISIFSGTLSEKYYVNDSLSRMFRAAMLWQPHNYVISKRKDLLLNKLYLQNVYISKEMSLLSHPPMGYSKNEQLIKTLHLDIWLRYIQKSRKNIHVLTGFEIDGKSYISFSFEGKGRHGVLNNSCTLIAEGKNIIGFEITIKNDEDFRVVQADSREHLYKTKSSTIKLSFEEYAPQMYRLTSFVSLITAQKKMNTTLFNTLQKTTFYLTEWKNNIAPNSCVLLDLKNPIYMEIKELKERNHFMPYTKEEMEFLNNKE